VLTEGCIIHFYPLMLKEYTREILGQSYHRFGKNQLCIRDSNDSGKTWSDPLQFDIALPEKPLCVAPSPAAAKCLSFPVRFGMLYHTFQIGTQKWLARTLLSTKSRNGVSIRTRCHLLRGGKTIRVTAVVARTLKYFDYLMLNTQVYDDETTAYPKKSMS
jgi:hypothetical protein